MAARSPRVQVSEPRFEVLGEGRVAVEVTVTNEGWLATHLTQRGAEGNVRPTGRSVIPWCPSRWPCSRWRAAAWRRGTDECAFPTWPARTPTPTPWLERSRVVRWIVMREGEGTDPIRVQVTIATAKGGTVRSEGQTGGGR
jgi:hypothetical protein